MTAQEPDFSKMTDAQIEALCNVAFAGHGYGINTRTLEKLADEGLIVRVPKVSRDRLGSFAWVEYEMEIPIHIRFCEWCSQQDEPAR